MNGIKVTSGRFQLDHDGSSYKAEPRTWFSQQTALQAPDVAEVGGIFWRKEEYIISSLLLQN